MPSLEAREALGLSLSPVALCPCNSLPFSLPGFFLLTHPPKSNPRPPPTALPTPLSTVTLLFHSLLFISDSSMLISFSLNFCRSLAVFFLWWVGCSFSCELLFPVFPLDPSCCFSLLLFFPSLERIKKKRKSKPNSFSRPLVQCTSFALFTTNPDEFLFNPTKRLLFDRGEI